jgi:hypothetical protein
VGDECDRHRQHGDEGQQATEALLVAPDFVSGKSHGVVSFYHAGSGLVCSYSHSTGGAEVSERGGDEGEEIGLKKYANVRRRKRDKFKILALPLPD